VVAERDRCRSRKALYAESVLPNLADLVVGFCVRHRFERIETLVRSRDSRTM
jgi:hypothetical protein